MLVVLRLPDELGWLDLCIELSLVGVFSLRMPLNGKLFAALTTGEVTVICGWLGRTVSQQLLNHQHVLHGNTSDYYRLALDDQEPML